MTPTKQKVYLPVKVEDVEEYSTHTINCEECEGLTDDEQYTCTHCWCEGGNGKLHFDDVFKKEELFVFTQEQLNAYTQSVIKQALETAAEKVFIDFEDVDYSEISSDGIVNKQSITNTFEETFKKFEV